jgi:hypothetical protein
VGETIGVFPSVETAKHGFISLQAAVRTCAAAPFEQIAHGTRSPGDHVEKVQLRNVVQGVDLIRWDLPSSILNTGSKCPLAAGVKGNVLFELQVCINGGAQIPWDKLFEAAMKKIPG